MGRSIVKDARLLVAALADPASVVALDAAGWTALIAMARAEQLVGTLAWRIAGLPVPPAVATILADARVAAVAGRRAALWEAEMARRALADLNIPVVLLKGTPFAAAGLMAGQGRSIGDLDILVPLAALDRVEAALIAARWEWVKEDAYDDGYYRRWMHELPPLIHRERDRMIDVHHTILPPTAHPTPDAAALIAAAVPLGNGLSVLSPADMIVHAAAHLFADGDLAGGLRNLWDIHCLILEAGTDGLAERAAHHGLRRETMRAARLAHALFATPIPDRWRTWNGLDSLYRRRLLARDGWGRPTRPATRFAFYVRSHWLRMPPRCWRGICGSSGGGAASQADDEQHDNNGQRIRDPVADVAIAVECGDRLAHLDERAEERQPLADSQQWRCGISEAPPGSPSLRRRAYARTCRRTGRSANAAASATAPSSLRTQSRRSARRARRSG